MPMRASGTLVSTRFPAAQQERFFLEFPNALLVACRILARISDPKNMPGQGIQLCAGYERLRGCVLHARPRMLELGEDLYLRRELSADLHGPNLPWHGLPEFCTDLQTEDQEDSVGPSAMP